MKARIPGFLVGVSLALSLPVPNAVSVTYNYIGTVIRATGIYVSGGAGADALDGGTGADIFTYNAVADSQASLGAFIVATGASIASLVSVADSSNPLQRDTIDLIATLDSGASSIDDLTADTTPSLSSAAKANSTVKVYDGVTLLGSTLATGAGDWSFSTAALANGADSLTATDGCT